jgi:hypothetical protein
VAVKEQRVDGSYCINSAQRLQSNLVGMQLRCTLMGFERNYQFKIPSNQLNKALFSTSIQDPKLNPWFVSGLKDAEGCFTITISPNEKWDFKCYINKTNNGGYKIVIPRKSLPILQHLLKDIVPSMMKHKIGL